MLGAANRFPQNTCGGALPWSVAVRWFFRRSNVTTVIRSTIKEDNAAQRLTVSLYVQQQMRSCARGSRAGAICQPMERISVRRRLLRWWRSLRRCTRLVNRQHVTLLVPLHSAQARLPHGRPSHVRAPCPHAAAVAAPRRRIRAGGHSVVLLARLALSSKCSPKSHPRLEAGRVYVWPRLSLDCRGVPPSHT